MGNPVTDPDLLRKLNASSGSRVVNDPDILRQLNGEGEMSWGEVGSGVANNLVSNAADYGGAMVDMAANPIDSFMAITKFLGGGLQEGISALGGESFVRFLGEDKEARDMFSGFVDGIKRDYGSMEGFKRALAERPVETMSDLSVVFNAGGLAKKMATAGVGAAAKKVPIAGALDSVPTAVTNAAQKASGVADKVISAGEMLDPLTALGRTAKGVAQVAGGAMQLPSGVGGAAVTEAFQSGIDGGRRGDDFRRGMRNPQGTASEAVDIAKAQAQQMRDQARSAYKQKMAEVGKSTEVIDFKKIEQSLQDALKRTEFNGQVTQPAAREKLLQVIKQVEEWKALDSGTFHTAEGMDALKQMVGEVREGIQYGTNARHQLDGVYNSIKSEIVNQAPIYADAMKGYSDSMELIKEFEKTLSTGRNASTDTTLRKLQSVMRDGVQANYGARANLAEEGAKYGDDFRPLVAGQSMSSWAPTGAARMGGLGSGATLAGYGAATMNPALAIPAAAGLAVSSPRLMGEAAHKVGQASSVPVKAAKGAKKGVEAVNDFMKLPGQEYGLLEFITDPVLRNAMYQALYGQGGVYEQ